MNIEFHYWVTGLIAEYAGFKGNESQIIALLCQFNDAVYAKECGI